MSTCSLSEFHYYEIEVLVKSTDKEGQGIGLVSGNCEAFVYPGWTAQTIGYHNDDGSLYVNGDNTEREYAGYNFTTYNFTTYNFTLLLSSVNTIARGMKNPTGIQVVYIT